MLHQDNQKNLSTKETIVVSQDCPKLLGSPVTCGSQRVKTKKLSDTIYLQLYLHITNDIP